MHLEDDEQIFQDFEPTVSKRVSDPIYKSERNSSSDKSSSESIVLQDFKILKFLSKGSFGSVFLAYLEQRESFFAIKCLNKDNIIVRDLIEKVKLEKLIMLEVEHPFIVKM